MRPRLNEYKRLERAGPRALTYLVHMFTPESLLVAVYDWSNNVIQISSPPVHRYGVRKITGFRYGFDGLTRSPFEQPIQLDPTAVAGIQHQGGTILGSSRGPQDPVEMIRNLRAHRVDLLFCIGGDGTMRGAHRLHETARDDEFNCAIVGIPKTIDNDLAFTERSFGFETAVSLASHAIQAAHVEASGAPKVETRLMGRHAGFIAASATLASKVDAVLVPDFLLIYALTMWLKANRVKGRAVVVVAEGAGQSIFR